MKKPVILAATVILTTSMLCGCNKAATASPAKDTAQPIAKSTEQTEDIVNIDDENTENTQKRIQIIIDDSKLGGFIGSRRQPPISGVRRHFYPDKSGNYTVEYIHTPYGMEKDETLDYKLSLNNDNTFELTVVSDGVTAEHSGRWYDRRGQLMLFYDEEIDPPKHNVYVADSMYCELLPKGKIMLYENGYTIVLSKQNEYEIMPLSNK
ncbi:MAG: hypothetical protein J1F71_05900 [Clostridiales bacterium]|nr:hypothetical protein [Clostridiales bacterium]